MKTITRHHNFENTINLVIQRGKMYYISSEKGGTFGVKRSPTLDEAFQKENWKVFEEEDRKDIDAR